MYNCVRGILGGRERAAGKVRSRFEKKKKTHGERKSGFRAGMEPATKKHRGAAGEPAPDPPVDIYIRLL